MKKVIWFAKLLFISLSAKVMRHFSWTRKILNRWETNLWSCATKARPHTFSLRPAATNSPTQSVLKEPANYMSWQGLTNKDYFSRHLGVSKTKVLNYPPLSEVAGLFQRQGDSESGSKPRCIENAHSNVLFMFFAQWFTDGVFRANSKDPKKTGSSHHVDLAQIYGSNEEETWALRSHKDGKLKVSNTSKGDFLPLLYTQSSKGKFEVSKDFAELSYLNNDFLDKLLKALPDDMLENGKLGKEAANKLYATGLRSGNATLGNLALNTLFVREHNSICNDLSRMYEFDDEQLFQTARMINTVLLIKLVIGDYINHIIGKDYFKLDVGFAEKQHWYRETWIPAEFNLLYRWHGLVPDCFDFDNQEIDFRQHFGTIEKYGLGQVLSGAVAQDAGDVGIGNSPHFLAKADEKMVALGRDWKLQSYNEYRSSFNLPRLTSYDQLTDQKDVANKLNALYGDIDNLEFIVGIFAEKKTGSSLLGQLQTIMVGYDAFTHLYTNPLLAKENFTEDNFTTIGMKRINDTTSLNQLIKRNTRHASDSVFDFRARSTCSKSATLSLCPYNKNNEGDAGLHHQFDSILCPSLRVAVKSGLISPDENGWVDSSQLRQFMKYIGFKEQSFLVSKIISLAEKATHVAGNNKRVNIVRFSGTIQDHGSSSGILNHPAGFNQNRLEHLKTFADQWGNFSERQLARAVKDFHQHPVNKANSLGAIFQLLELGSLLHVFGHKDRFTGKKVLAGNDIDYLWKYSQFPQGWCPPNQNKANYGTLKAFRVHLVMGFWYVFCDVSLLLRRWMRKS